MDKSLQIIKREILNREKIIEERTEKIKEHSEGIELALDIFLDGIKIDSYNKFFETINTKLKERIAGYDFGVWYVKGSGKDYFFLQNSFGLKSEEIKENLSVNEVKLLYKLQEEDKIENLINVFKDNILRNKEIEINDLKLVVFVSLKEQFSKVGPSVFEILGSKTKISEVINKEEIQLLCTVINLFLSEIDYNNKLRETVEELEKANRAKIDFINTISHELRTPLNSILGFSQMLSTGTYGEISEEQKEALSKIRNSGVRLLNLINSLLESARLEAKRREIIPGIINQELLIKRVKDEIHPLIEKKALKFKVNVNIKRQEIYSDYSALNEIMINLLSNAVKYTDRGEIELNYSEDGKKLRIEVKDTGKGIPKEKLEKIFEPFEIGSSKKGVGLGLSITKRLVELLHGNIGVESEVGKGGRFWVEIPLKEFPSLKNAKPEPVENSVLIIEDNPEDIELIKDLFEREGKDIFVTRTGREAFTILNKFIPRDSLCRSNPSRLLWVGNNKRSKKKERVQKNLNLCIFCFREKKNHWCK